MMSMMIMSVQEVAVNDVVKQAANAISFAQSQEQFLILFDRKIAEQQQFNAFCDADVFRLQHQVEDACEGLLRYVSGGAREVADDVEDGLARRACALANLKQPLDFSKHARLLQFLGDERVNGRNGEEVEERFSQFGSVIHFRRRSGWRS